MFIYFILFMKSKLTDLIRKLLKAFQKMQQKNPSNHHMSSTIKCT